MRTKDGVSRAAAVGIVLAGGLSSRMGEDKSRLDLGGTTLLSRAIARLAEQVHAVAVSSNATAPLAIGTDIEVFGDTLPGRQGPMAGVLSAMHHAARNFPDAVHIVTVATDTPFFPADLVVRLEDASASRAGIPVASCDGHLHPVFALWPIALADDLEAWLQTDEKRRVRAFIERHGVIEVAFPRIEIGQASIDPFFNINTPAELEQARQWLDAMETTGR